MASLWGDDFNIPTESIKNTKILNKIKNPKVPKVTSDEQLLKSSKVSNKDKIQLIEKKVHQILGVYESNTIVIKTKTELINYVSTAIQNEIIAVDTETNNSLDPITCQLMGVCIYTPGNKNAYIPINHVDIDTGTRLSWQLTEKDIFEELSKINSIKILMHNGKFDYQVLKCTCGLELNIYWDTLIGCRILDENERAGLKEQYISKIDNSIEKYDIEHLFEKMQYAIFDPNLFALYAATDAYMTYKLYEYQLKIFSEPSNQNLFNVFKTVEMPVIPVIAEIELNGISIDNEYSSRLSQKYHKLVEETDFKIAQELSKYQQTITQWKLTPEANFHPMKNGKETKSKSEQLSDPISVTSPTQLAILFYDILKIPVIDKNTPRGTGEDILSKINLPICKLILEKRGIEKLITTYIDKLPACVCPKDNRLHAHFNQIGAGTGRLSSSDPNLQNIPSHNKEIRMMFIPKDGNVFVGGDWSQQEPRLLAAFSNDKNMIGAYKQGKDLYATMGTKVYKNDYWDNMEHYQDGTPNPQGKKRRGSMKTLLLGVMYGMGANSIAENLNVDIKEAQKIIDDFYMGFPDVKNWVDSTKTNAKQNGYVEDLWGRRRRLPDIMLPRYTVKTSSKNTNTNFNPLLHTKGIIDSGNELLINKYKNLLINISNRKDYTALQESAKSEGISILDNGGYISRAERECVNARIQGSAASMAKIALRRIYDNTRLKELGFKMVLQIHDEIIGECPKSNSEEVSKVLTEIMLTCVNDKIQVPFKCDVEQESCWYEHDYASNIKKEYTELLNNYSNDSIVAFKYLCNNHTEHLPEKLKTILE